MTNTLHCLWCVVGVCVRYVWFAGVVCCQHLTLLCIVDVLLLTVFEVNISEIGGRCITM